MKASSRQADATGLLTNWRAAEGNAPAHLVTLVYDELRAIARSYLARERRGHTLQPTALVHEAYLRLVDETRVSWQNRAHFLGVAAQAMRRILVDHARAQHALKRGGGRERVSLEEGMEPAGKSDVDLLALDDALHDLAALDQRQSQIVELRFFAGLTIEETAEVLETSPRTVKREWRLARAWLRREIFDEEETGAHA